MKYLSILIVLCVLVGCAVSHRYVYAQGQLEEHSVKTNTYTNILGFKLSKEGSQYSVTMFFTHPEDSKVDYRTVIVNDWSKIELYSDGSPTGRSEVWETNLRAHWINIHAGPEDWWVKDWMLKDLPGEIQF